MWSPVSELWALPTDHLYANMLLQLIELENTSLCTLFFQDCFGYSGFLIFPYEFQDASKLADSTVWLLSISPETSEEHAPAVGLLGTVEPLKGRALQCSCGIVRCP